VSRFISLWFFSCGLIALITTGIVPILVPLEVVQVEGSPKHVGIIMAAIGAGMMTSPVWAYLAHRFSCHKILMVLASAGTGLSLVGFDASDDLGDWLGCGFLTGCCVAAGFTLANIIIVTRYPDEAKERIGWLQTLITAGTVAGLVVAGTLERFPFHAGVWAGAVTATVAAILAAISVPNLPPPPKIGEPGARPPMEWTRPYLALLFLWFFSNSGAAGLTALYPLIMRTEFNIPPDTSAYVMAGATAVSTFLFVFATRALRALGKHKVMILSLTGRMLAMFTLAVLSYQDFPGRDTVALTLFSIVGLLWPFLSVAATLLAAEVAVTKSRGLAYFDGSAALAHLVGPVVAGYLANVFGYESVLVLSAGTIAVGLLISPWLYPSRLLPKSLSGEFAIDAINE